MQPACAQIRFACATACFDCTTPSFACATRKPDFATITPVEACRERPRADARHDCLPWPPPCVSAHPPHASPQHASACNQFGAAETISGLAGTRPIGTVPAAASHPTARPVKSFENIYKLHNLLRNARYPVSLERVREELRCSRSTAQRVIGYLRDQIGAPIETTTDPSGYRYTHEAFELPGIWFEAAQIHALLLMQQLMLGFEPGLLSDLLGPLRKRLEAILDSQGLGPNQASRIRMLKMASRHPGPFFKLTAIAVLQRQRISIGYDARTTGEVTRREVSPQRLTHYRDNWYLDAWCHLRNALRTFSVDCIDAAELQPATALDIDNALLDRELGSCYGILSGEPTAIAMLRFKPRRARWVAHEQWHPDQRGWHDDTGHYVLELPYHRPDELIMDITHYGADVEVLAPIELRQSVAQSLREALAQYD